MTLRQKIVLDLEIARAKDAIPYVSLIIHFLADHITDDDLEFLWESGAQEGLGGEMWFDRKFGSTQMREVIKQFIDR